jgi:CubicO group peptidase (beta-lactamase class C family)
MGVAVEKAMARMLVGLAAVIAITLIALLPFVLLTPRAPPPPRGLDTVAKLETYLESLTANQTPPAIQLVVIKNGATVYAKAFGVSDGPARKTAASGDVYHYWSVTKLFTATAIMQLVDDGKLSLDDPVTRHLPDFKTSAPSGTPVEITIRQLLAHTSGMRNLRPSHLIGWIHGLAVPPLDQVALVGERMQWELYT